MAITIEATAYKAILYGTLSCKCPVTPETETAFFDHYFRSHDQQVIDFAPIAAIADGNPMRTPVHNLLEIASYGHDDPSSFCITMGDVLRALGSLFHFKTLVANLNHQVVRDVPSFLVSHMLVPTQLSIEGRRTQANYATEKGQIFFDNIFVPADIEIKERQLYGLHMGAVICELSLEQANNLNAHLLLITEFEHLCSCVQKVDFHNFQFYGDYHLQVRNRFQHYFDK